jgi:hypothetical protein
MYKTIFLFKRRDSLTNILQLLDLPSFDTVLHNSSVSFSRLWNTCNSHVVSHLRGLDQHYWCA